MSHEVDIHSAQASILRELLFVPEANFAKLQKPTGLDSDHFKFHMQRLVELGYVKRVGHGLYTLSKSGKEYSNRLDTDTNTVEKQPKISVGLIIEDSQGRFVSQQRLKQPYFGYWGRPTGKVRWGETLLEAAARELDEETGLTATLKVGGFYHKMDYDKDSNELLEDKLFCIVYGKNPSGTFIEDMEGHHNEWLTLDEMMKKDKVFQSVPEITLMCKGEAPGFIEQAYYYDKADY